MEIIFLGTGTSQGVPMIAHPEGGCDLGNPKKMSASKSSRFESSVNSIVCRITWLSNLLALLPFVRSCMDMERKRRRFVTVVSCCSNDMGQARSICEE